MRLLSPLLVVLALAACDRSVERTGSQTSSVGATTARAAVAVASDTVVVYKSPTCRCCANWVDHMRQAGFPVITHDVADVEPIKRQRGVPSDLTSCHTAVVGQYALEGHVPAEDVRRLLRERPAVAGLTVPGMPTGSPGMEGLTRDRYDVLSFDSAGASAIYASH